jgi:DNA mismatch endonuclease (patch repair protein)
MADMFSKEKRSDIMSLIRSKETRIEVNFRKQLWRIGFRYSKNPAKYFGKPDLAMPKYRTVIFIDGCFWHGCRKHSHTPRSNKEYWKLKIRRNKARDKEVSKYYKKHGWNVIRIWEHDLKMKDIAGRVAEKIRG